MQLHLDGPLAGRLKVAGDAKKARLPLRDDLGSIARNIHLSKITEDCGSVYVYAAENPVLVLIIQGKTGTFTRELTLPSLTPGKEYWVEVTGDLQNVLFKASLSDWTQGDSGESKV